MQASKNPPLKPTTVILAVGLVFFLALAALGGVTIWTIEHYMDITPADWPYPGSFWDIANDLTCGVILLPSGTIGRFCFWLVFFPIPILIEMRRGHWQKVMMYLLCVTLPFSYTDSLFDNAFADDALASVIVLLLALIATPFLIKSWSSGTSDTREQFLLRANLIALWLILVTADIMLGLNMHQSYCKVSITHALMQ